MNNMNARNAFRWCIQISTHHNWAAKSFKIKFYDIRKFSNFMATWDVLNPTRYVIECVNHIKNLIEKIEMKIYRIIAYEMKWNLLIMQFLTSNAPSQSVDLRNDSGLSLMLTKVCWISSMDGISLAVSRLSGSTSIVWRFFAIHEHIDCNVRYAQPHPFFVNEMKWNEIWSIHITNCERFYDNILTYHIIIIITTVMKV